MSNFKKGVVRDRKYLDWLRTQPCAASGYDFAPTPSEPAHTFKGPGGGGMGMKSGDDCALPLSHTQHQEQHRVGELTYWRNIISNDDALLKQMVCAFARQFYYERYLDEKER